MQQPSCSLLPTRQQRDIPTRWWFRIDTALTPTHSNYARIVLTVMPTVHKTSINKIQIRQLGQMRSVRCMWWCDVRLIYIGPIVLLSNVNACTYLKYLLVLHKASLLMTSKIRLEGCAHFCWNKWNLLLKKKMLIFACILRNCNLTS